MIDHAVVKQKRRNAEIVRDIGGVIFGHDFMEHGLSRFPRTEQLSGESTLNFLSIG